MNLALNKSGKEFSVTVNEDLSATIDGRSAKFDPLYNAVILDEGYLVEESYVNGLRLDSVTVKKIMDLNKTFMKSYDKHLKEQKEYIPKIVKLVGEKFVYDSPFELNVANSDVVDKLNLLVEGDLKLIKKIVGELMTSDGYIQVKDLQKLPEFKEYISKLKKYDKLRKKHEEKQKEFENEIEDKTRVGMFQCRNCNEYFITGDDKGKYLSKVVFFSAKNEWFEIDENDNEYEEFCLGISENFVYLKTGESDECKLCRI